MKCLKCGQTIESNWKVCPQCGNKISEATGPTVSISDSVVKELHQTEQIDNREAHGANVGGNININVGQDGKLRQSESAEYLYEQYVMTILQSGGSLELARAELEQRRKEMGLTLKRSSELETSCLSLVKETENSTMGLKSVKSGSNGFTRPGVSSATTRHRRKLLWTVVLASICVIGIIGVFVVILLSQTSGTSSPEVTPSTSSTTTPTVPPSASPTQASSNLPASYNISVTITPPGSGMVSPGGGSYKTGSTTNIQAIPTNGWQFSGWSGDASGTSPTITLTIGSDKNIIANFIPIGYRLLTAVSPIGSGSINPSSGSYDSGTQVTLSATPSSGWKFDQWSGTDDNSINPSTVTMTGNKNVTVYFITQDTDEDGLTDDEEKQLGTNPSNEDTDQDGLSDYQEAKVMKTNPLNPDTDGDGMRDGNDLFPLYDAYVQVSIKYFDENSAPGVYIDGGIFPSYGEPYFKIWVGTELKFSNQSAYSNVKTLQNPYSASFNIPKNSQFVFIRIEVWDSDPLGSDEQYDAGSTLGSTPDAYAYIKQFDVLGGVITETSDGTADGSLEGPQAKIIIEIRTIP